MWAMLPGPDGVPKRGRVIPFGQHLDRAMDIEVGPDGDLLYVDQDDESLRRIEWVGNSSNQPPVADAQADTVTGNSPLTVTFGSAGTGDPDPADLLIYEWDLDGDGELDDSTEQAPTHTYLQGGTFTVTLRVTDTSGATATDTLTITVGSGPMGSIDTPAAGTTWATGRRDRILRLGDGQRGRRAAGRPRSTGASCWCAARHQATARRRSWRTCRTRPAGRSRRPTASIRRTSRSG